MQNPSCMDLLLASDSYAVQQTKTVCYGCRDGHELNKMKYNKMSIPEGNPR